MRLERSNAAVLATALLLLGFLFLLPGAAAGAVIDKCADGSGNASCEIDLEADTGDTGDSGTTGDGGDGGGGGDSGDAEAGNGIGGGGGSAGPGGDGGGNGGNGGGGGAAGGSGNYSGATIENSLKTSSSSPGQIAGGLSAAGISPSGKSSAAPFGGGGGGSSSSSSGGAETGGAGGTYCAECSITLGGADMVNVSSWQIEGAPPSFPAQSSPSEPKENSPSAILLAGLFLLVVFARIPFSPLGRLFSKGQ